MIDGFGKIKLEFSGKVNKTSLNWKWILGILSGLILLVLVLILVVFFPARDLFLDVQKTGVSAKELYAVLKNQDLELSASKLKTVQSDLHSVQKNLARFSYLQVLPFIGDYQRDAQHMVVAGISSLNALDISVTTIIPYSDLLGLKGKSTFVSGSADDRIKTAVETLDKVVPSLDEIAREIAVGESELNMINPNRYPAKIGTVEIKKNIETVKNLYTETAGLFVNAQPLLKQLPDILGSKTPKLYLIIFQNDAELRATGGFITAYAIFQVKSGKIQVVKADDIYKLDEAKKKKYPAPSPILKYHKNVYSQELRDSNLSPDFVASMKDFEKMLYDSVPDFPKVDGIIALDTHVLVSSIKILGEFNVYGKSFSAENDSRCDCPKAIYELEDYATRPVAYLREERKDIIGVLLYQLMQRALGVSPSQYWGKLSQMFLDETKQKHVLFYFHDTEAQKGIEALNFAGRIKSYDADYIHINNVNFAGAKSNLFVTQYANIDIVKENDGTIVNTLTLSYKNPSPPSNCNLEAGQLCLNGILRNWLRIYVPKGSRLLDFTGSEKDVVTYEELDKTVFEGFLTVKPQGSAEVKVRYNLPFKLSNDGFYRLLIQKQPGTDKPEWTLLKDGNKKDTFELSTDKEVNMRL